MNEGYRLFAAQLDEAIKNYPLLVRTRSGEKEILTGILPVVDKAGKHWEDYQIEIHCSDNYPYEFPKLYETSGKIPKIGDWHVYEDSLSCCVKVRPEEILRCKKGITVTEYIREDVMPYLFNQTHRRVEGYYVNGEYSHGLLGVLEYYSEILNCEPDLQKTLKILEYILTRQRPLRNSSCFCGSDKKFRHCHRDAFDLIETIGRDIVSKHYKLILDFSLKSNNN